MHSQELQGESTLIKESELEEHSLSPIVDETEYIRQRNRLCSICDNNKQYASGRKSSTLSAQLLFSKYMPPQQHTFDLHDKCYQMAEWLIIG